MARGKLKRVGVIMCLLLVIQQYCTGQMTSLSGELRYEHQYQDFLPEGGSLSTSLRQEPVLNLNFLGDVISKRILAYSLFTSLTANFTTSHSGINTFSTNQYNWNTYNLIVNVLPYAKAKLDLAARENLTDIKSGYDTLEARGRTKQQEQRVSLSVDQVPSLPTMSLAYVRNRSWAILGDPSEQVSQQYSFGLSTSRGTTAAAGLSGSLSDIKERYTGLHEQLLTINLTGSKQLADRHQLNLNVDYNRFTSYGNLSGSIGYTGIIDEKFRVSSGVSGLSYSSSTVLGRNAGISEGIVYLIDPHYQLGVNVRGNVGTQRIQSFSDVKIYPSNEFGGNTTLQHNRMVGTTTITNGFTFGYLVQEYVERHTTVSGGFSNGIQFPLNAFVINGDYSFSYTDTKNGDRWQFIGNNAGVMVNGVLPYQVRSNTGLRYRDDHYSGNVSTFRNQRNLMFSQRFDGSFTYIIPFTLGLGGSVNWYFASIRGQTHSWQVMFSSPSFFLRGLYANYVYMRTYDPYFHREVTEHNGSLLHQWRALSFQLRFRYATFPVRIRDISFSVSRPF